MTFDEAIAALQGMSNPSVSELHCDATYRDRTRNFSIKCPSGSVGFSATSQQIFGEEDASYKITWHVQNNLHISGEIKRENAIRIIDDALTAYKQLNGLPELASTTVKYEFI